MAATINVGVGVANTQSLTLDLERGRPWPANWRGHASRRQQPARRSRPGAA
ncbi:MAG: hypothetical protein WKG07_09225 [Hymenobacter sp.]